MSFSSPLKVGFAGLGSMGFGMAKHLLKEGFDITGYDVHPPSLERFQKAGGATSCTAREAARGKDCLICMVASAQQATPMLFDPKDGAIQGLPTGAVILITSTVPASYHDELRTRLNEAGRSDLLVVDSPVSGGTIRAAEGTLTVLVSGAKTAQEKVGPVLRALSEKLYVIPGEVGAASNVKMINQLLVGVHIAASAEAMGLAARSGLNTREVYDVIRNAAGNSWGFNDRTPHMLDNDFTPLSALNIFVKDMGIVTASARLHKFPVPLASAAEQLWIAGAAQGYGKDDDAGLVRTFLPGAPSLVHEQSRVVPEKTGPTPSTTPVELAKIGFVGLGAMGQGMAGSLVRSGFSVHGYDLYRPSIDKFLANGKNAVEAKCPAEAAKDAQLLIIMVQNATQVEEVLFGSGNAVASLPQRATIMLMSTVSPSFARGLQHRLAATGKEIDMVDAPVSGGVVRAAKGDLTIICSGTKSAFAGANTAIAAMSGTDKNIHRIQGGAGAASAVKLINQLLAGVHIAAAAEAMAFGAKLGLNTKTLYEIICTAAGSSWMFQNRVPAMLAADWTPHSALAIFVKDLGIVLEEAKRLSYPATMSAAAHQLYMFGALSGWSDQADAGIVRLFEMSGVSVSKSTVTETEVFTPRQYPTLSANTLEDLPAAFEGEVLSTIRNRINNESAPVLVVLDDDPTGTQTCHDISVLTVWDHETLLAEFQTGANGFFILTNSRAFPTVEAKQLIATITRNVAKAASEAKRPFNIVLRGDSTLRGHMPTEPDAVEEVLGQSDAWIVAPFFFQGGRFTIDDVHYVKEGESLVPASQTPFAKDATFGYQSSNLRDYVREKCGLRFDVEKMCSITLSDIRVGGPSKVTEKLLATSKGNVVIVNAAEESDMYVFAAGLLEAESTGKRYLYRTGAAFVSCRLGITSIPPLTMRDLRIDVHKGNPGGLIIAGSYVPKTTAQLKSLRERRQDKLDVIELDVEQLIHSEDSKQRLIVSTIEKTSNLIKQGNDVLVMTSRKLIVGHDGDSSLQIGSVVAQTLVQILSNIEIRPRYVIAKGGITSSDAATKGLKMKRVQVVGQAAKGVPLWRCDEVTSRHQGVPYVVFPGNVGTDDTLAELVESWASDA